MQLSPQRRAQSGWSRWPIGHLPLKASTENSERSILTLIMNGTNLAASFHLLRHGGACRTTTTRVIRMRRRE
jgi:hypothetical protein